MIYDTSTLPYATNQRRFGACGRRPFFERTTIAMSSPAPEFRPLYLQIRDSLVKSLESGEWSPGQAIPSEVELAGRYGVAQGTVRRAVEALAADNLLVRRQGKGTF